jgi:chromate transporter
MVMLPGYRLAGIPGALVALLAIFLPSAIMASLVTARWEALRRMAWFPAVRRGLGAVALGLLLAGAYTIARVAVVDVASGLIAGIAFVVLWRWQLHPALVILAGGVAAVVVQAVVG